MCKREDLRDAKLALRWFPIKADRLTEALGQRRSINTLHRQRYEHLESGSITPGDLQIGMLMAREKLDTIITGLMLELEPVRLWLLTCPDSEVAWLRYANCLSVGDVSRALGISRWTVRRETISGLIELKKRLDHES